MKVIASHNGLEAARLAYQRLAAGDPPLDACVAGVELVEDDPEELTVGYGGLPNEQGVVELDAGVMDGASHRGAAVAALRDIRHPTRLAKLLMEQTNRVMLVGEGARQFALANGMQPENLLTDKARRMWMYWRRQRRGDDWRPPSDDEQDHDLARWFANEFYGGGTVHVAALDDRGNLACATSTSGHAFKLAGRVGDSPILGAGLYADNDLGTCGSIGHGEANMLHLSSYAVVSRLEHVNDPAEAGLAVLRQIANKTPPALCDDHRRPKFNLQLFVLTKEGRHAGAAMWSEKQIAVADSDGARLEPCAALFQSDRQQAAAGD